MSERMQIHELQGRPDPTLVAQFREMVTPHLSDSLERLSGTGSRIRPMYAGGTLAGGALTVKTAAGDNLLVHKALDMAKPGDVVVVDAGGYTDRATVGELMCAYAKRRGIAGLVIWGAIRDSAELARESFPVFAAGVTHRGPYRTGPGEINVPVVIDGMIVNPGDIIVGDADGLIAIPQVSAARILASAKAILEKETAAMKQFVQGTADRSWVDKALLAKGYKLPA
jgi:regulator of RNase E activity RraA